MMDRRCRRSPPANGRGGGHGRGGGGGHGRGGGSLQKETSPVHLAAATLLQTVALIYLVLVTECRDYCHNQDFTAECLKPGEVILMESARYGRMKFGPCVREGFGYVGCSADVIESAHERCSGRKTCVIRVPDATLDLRRPCNDDLKSYLETTYTCISVADADSESCKLSLEPNQSYGYIPSTSMTEGTRSPRPKQLCGSAETPWVLSVPSGQRINITLMDFTSSSVPYDGQATTGSMSPITTTSAQSTSATPCDLYAIIEEEKPTKRTNICGSGIVELSQAFASAGDLIKVTVFHRTEESARFLLRYEAIGCPDVTKAPPNVWLKREINRMVAGCVASTVKWEMDCVENRWEGTPINCSTVGSHARREDGLASLSVGASILIILGVSLAIGLVVLLFGLYYMKRRREGLPLGVRGHQMRDLKPLSSDAAYEAPSVYARNTAFEPARVATHQRSGKAVAVDDGNEYEYVWDVPSNMMPSGAKATRALDEDTCHARPPDLIRAERRGAEASGRTLQKVAQCSCLTDAPHSTAKQRSSTFAKPRDISSTPSTRFASLESRSRMGGRMEGGPGRKTVDLKGMGGGGGRGGACGEEWDSAADAPRMCRHCGHSVADEPLAEVMPRMTPTSATMVRRPFPGQSATTKTRPTMETTSGKRSGAATISGASTVAPVTLPRTQRH